MRTSSYVGDPAKYHEQRPTDMLVLKVKDPLRSAAPTLGRTCDYNASVDRDGYSRVERDSMGGERIIKYDNDGDRVGYLVRQTDSYGQESLVEYDRNDERVGFLNRDSSHPGGERWISYDNNYDRLGFVQKDTGYGGQTSYTTYTNDYDRVRTTYAQQDGHGGTVYQSYSGSTAYDGPDSVSYSASPSRSVTDKRTSAPPRPKKPFKLPFHDGDIGFAFFNGCRWFLFQITIGLLLMCVLGMIEQHEKNPITTALFVACGFAYFFTLAGPITFPLYVAIAKAVSHD